MRCKHRPAAPSSTRSRCQRLSPSTPTRVARAVPSCAVPWATWAASWAWTWRPRPPLAASTQTAFLPASRRLLGARLWCAWVAAAAVQQRHAPCVPWCVLTAAQRWSTLTRRGRSWALPLSLQTTTTASGSCTATPLMAGWICPRCRGQTHCTCARLKQTGCASGLTCTFRATRRVACARPRAARAACPAPSTARLAA